MKYGCLRRIESRDDYTEIGMKVGSFGFIKEVMPNRAYLVSSWETCREQFHEFIGSCPIRVFLFCHHPNKRYAVAAFMDKVEQMVKAPTRTVIGPTQLAKVSYIRISPWWMKDDMRKSLLTILLRVGQYYDPKVGNFEQTLCATRYSRQTLPAIQRFLKGYTWYTGDVIGWNNQFFHDGRCGENKEHRRACPPDKRRIHELLVRPGKQSSTHR